MAYKRPPFPMHEGTSPHKSALKDIESREKFPVHNPAHRDVGDESDAAHDTPEWKEARDKYLADHKEKIKAAEKKAEENPNKEKIDALRAELRTFNEFEDIDRYDAIMAEIKKLRAE